MAAAAVNPARISIVIPALNEAGCIGCTLGRLQAMRQRGHELIVVDGGSDDGTPVICQSLVDRLILTPPGRAIQMRAGAAAASGSILWFLHADTLSAETADILILGSLARRDNQWGRFDIGFSGGRRVFVMIAFFMNLRARLGGIATGDQGIFVTRAFYDQVGGIPDIPIMEDIALSRMLREYSRPAVIRNKLTSSPRRWETQGILRTILKMWCLRLAFFLGIAPARLAKYYAVNSP